MVVISEISSTSSSPCNHKFDVFLSFRGSDTRNNFTAYLHEALLNANITTFLDDEEIETGLSLKPELETAIKASRASIIVLSPDYASSKWCLNELVSILDQKRTSSHIVIPIFYHVEPTDIRKQQNSFGDAMAKHKGRMDAETNVEQKNQLAEKIEIWQKALTEVAGLKGKNANGRKEPEFIKEIVSDILGRLGGVPLRVTLPHLIGMDHHIKFITSWLKDGSSHIVDILTILGMGGIGKTSLARFVFNSHYWEFEKSSFIEDISRRAGQFNGLLDLQKQICGDISNTSSIQGHDKSLYTSHIENTLARKKVFLVLDDVDSLAQLDVLLGNKGFYPGSKVIITTKDSSLTERCELFNHIVQPKHTKRSLAGLYKHESLALLSYQAFNCNIPNVGYEEVSIKLVEYCEGLPLALEILGKSLRKRDVSYWEDCLEALKKETDHPGITNVLQMSFDSLPFNNDRELFKHIACFFVGKDRVSTEIILKACGIHTVSGIRNLIDRCLLRIGKGDTLIMHQLVQAMGRHVVRQESPNKPWKRSRLWCHEESFNVLDQNKGTRKLEGLLLDMEMLEEGYMCRPIELKTDAFSKMDNLMLLQLNYVRVGGSYENFPKKLRWLCMHGFPLEYIPANLQLENLVALDMSYSSFESLDMSYGNSQRPGESQKLSGSCSKDNKRMLRSLKILNLSFCKQLQSLGGFIELPALERLLLSNCIGLTEVCESIEQCPELAFVDLSYCNMLKKLPNTMVKLKKVKVLKLDGCDLGEFSIEMRDDMELPEIFNGNNMVINSQMSSSVIVETIPRGFGSFVISLPSSLVCLSLERNHLSNESFPVDMSSLSLLKELNLEGNFITSLPNCVRSLPSLEILSVHHCNQLMTLAPPSTLKHLLCGYCIPNMESKVVFDRDMSPIKLSSTVRNVFMEGLYKVEDMADVKEEVLRGLGWTNLDFTKIQTGFTFRMVYELGIFSTYYRGKEMPNWISDRRDGSSISFTIPSSPYNLRGLNFCFVRMVPKGNTHANVGMKISNITKKHTWIYPCYWVFGPIIEGIIIYLSHWMFGKNEMEDGDQITISILLDNNVFGISKIRECGISLVYDEDGKNKMEEEEDVLGYYKSWNHIIGGDLSPFQTTTPGEYYLDKWHFLGFNRNKNYIGNINKYLLTMFLIVEIFHNQKLMHI